jgi:L-alanine-DL-glutamate epimerase-like enolase superfamily enzyme
MSGGINIFRVLLGHDRDWRRDADRLHALRETVGPRATVIGDWQGRGDRVSAIRTARETAGLDLILEQPCATAAECAAVRLASGQVMKLDEGLQSPGDVLAAHAAGALDAATIKLSRVGGIGAARKMRDLCVALGVPVSIEDVAGSDIAMSAVLQVAATTPRDMLLFTLDMSSALSPRLDRYGASRRSGLMAAPEAPGLGIEPDLDTMGAPFAVIE